MLKRKKGKKRRHGGFSGEGEGGRKSQRECVQFFRARRKEVGVGFGGTGKVAEDLCSFRPYMHAAKPIFYTFSCIYCSDTIVKNENFLCWLIYTVERKKR